MGISLKTHKLLWGRSGNRCAICKDILVVGETETDDSSVVGEECHIVARDKNGPRGDEPMPATDRDKASNLILLCQKHHKVVDDHPAVYDIQQLRDIKQAHETWVRETLGSTKFINESDLKIAASIDTWAELAHVGDWPDSYASLVSDGIPRLHIDRLDALKQLCNFLHGRFREYKHERIEQALDVFNLVLNDFLIVFCRFAQPSSGFVRTDRFYKISEWNPERYDRLFRAYETHVAIVEDLYYELTRAANFVVHRIRENLHTTFRQAEGILLPERVSETRVNSVRSRAEYLPTDVPYESFEDFVSSSERRLLNSYTDEKILQEYLQRLSK